MSSFELFEDGIANYGHIFRADDRVLRPAGPHTPAVHRLLKHLQKAGFKGAPVAHAILETQELVSYIPGTVPKPPYDDWFLADETIYKIAQLLRSFHDAVQSFVPEPDSVWNIELADPMGVGIVCHNDLGPGNIVFENHEPTAFIDWDFAAPGRALWDITRAARVWVPLDDPESAATYGFVGIDPFKRLRVFCEGYGLDADQRHELVDLLEQCNRVSTAYVQAEFKAGIPAFVKIWKDYNLDVLYPKRAEWIADNNAALHEAVR